MWVLEPINILIKLLKILTHLLRLALTLSNNPFLDIFNFSMDFSVSAEQCNSGMNPEIFVGFGSRGFNFLEPTDFQC